MTLDAGDWERGYRVLGYAISVVDAVEMAVQSVCESIDFDDVEDEVACKDGFWPWPPADLQDEDLVLFLDKIAVRDDRRRGKGWGRRFIGAIERWALSRGCKGVLLHAGALWGAAHASDGFWLSMGYEVADEWDFVPVMYKPLAQSRP